MIKLTDYRTEKVIYVNPTHVINFSEYLSDGSTTIILPYHEDGSHILVKESPEEVVRLIEEAKRQYDLDTAMWAWKAYDIENQKRNVDKP